MAAASAVVVQALFFIKIGMWVVIDPGMTSFMRAQQLRLESPEPNVARVDATPARTQRSAAVQPVIQHSWVAYDRISRNIKRAVIAAEDSNFTEHDGVDWEALERAWQKNQRRGHVVAGGSTLTQQLAKNLFLTADRSYVRKGQEFVITWMIEFWMDKPRILEVYLNVVEWGVGVFGIEAAAHHYYGIPASALSAPQAAKLAAMLPNPRYFDRNRNHPQLLRKTATVLARMGGATLP
ncbi:monofunctional biosynthetic peptidoglycan transglycosylase [Derxia gummosa]|uniref:Biosynthetic peptidoglycan transglycosylase n=1 Tax=Derxia gummosa DSM 723 TaxID=1121388 RepID=A0A8B6XBI1_9BURK|nr:monofunctional biosynthetic peptidoglycan transglycosylase [Derxia gummosa]